MGPTFEVELKSSPDNIVLNEVDAYLAYVAGQIDRTRKGRVWDVWVEGRPFHVAVTESPPGIMLSAGCNSPEDHEWLQRLSRGMTALGG